MMDSSERQDGRPESAGSSPDALVGVEGELLEDLAARYAQYRQALTGPFDPVKILALTGGVLQSVSTILTAIGQPPGQRTDNPGKAGK